MRQFNNHRFILRRNWIGTGGRLNFVPFNPSKANDTFDDNTVRKMIGFGKRWGFSGIDVTNLYAFRSTDPGEIQRLAIRDMEYATGGEENDRWVLDTARQASMIVVAWGGLGRIMGRDEDVLRLLEPFDLYCIGKTRDGFPLHPCRVGYTDKPELFRSALQQKTPMAAAVGV